MILNTKDTELDLTDKARIAAMVIDHAPLFLHLMASAPILSQTPNVGHDELCDKNVNVNVAQGMDPVVPVQVTATTPR